MLGRRISRVQGLLVWGIALIMIVGAFFALRSVFLGMFNQKAKEIVSLVADTVDWEKLEPYVETGEENEYAKGLQQFFNDVKEDHKDLAFIYMYIPGEDSFTYIMEGAREGDNPEDLNSFGDVWFYSEYEYLHLVPDIKAKKASDKLHEMKSEYGKGLEAWAPVFDESGELRAMVECDYYVADVYTQIMVLEVAFVLFFVVCIFTMVIISRIYLDKNLSEPVTRLTDAVDSYEHGKMDLDVDSFVERDELRHLAESFEAMTKRIEAYNKEVARISAEKERIGAELNIATKIQEDMLPRIFPPFPDNPEIDIYAIMNPAKEVGGDFYDFFMVDDDHIAMVIADVSSKGVPAALFMVISKTLIKNQTMSGNNIAEVFANVNNQLCEGNDECMFVTAFMAVVNIKTGEMEYVNAGHEPFLHRHKGRWNWVRPECSFILAGLPDMEYKVEKMQLEPGDRLYMFTDGVSEAQNLNHDLYGEDNIYESIVKRGSTGLKRMLTDMRKDIDTFVGKADQFDDITMLVFEYKNKK